VAGIFFKFAIDNNNIYGNDGLAAKCAGHELKAASALFSCAMLVGLHRYPLIFFFSFSFSHFLSHFLFQKSAGGAT
jgi:hypothetical protein